VNSPPHDDLVATLEECVFEGMPSGTLSSALKLAKAALKNLLQRRGFSIFHLVTATSEGGADLKTKSQNTCCRTV
jgi:hypothetical protein